MARWPKTALVVVGAMVLSTVAIQANDIMRGITGNMAGGVITSDGPCGAGAIQLNLSTGALCVDIYESAPATSCPRQEFTSAEDTQVNLNEAGCQPVSTAAVMPWRFVSLTQAQQLCARSGKRLPTNAEWYQVAVAQSDQSTCILDGSVTPAGAALCVTAAGINDVVGNVWEWVDGQVTDGQYDGRAVPEAGYVKVADQYGIVLETSGEASTEYGADYAKTAPTGVYGVIRGGFYGSNTDGGIYAQNLAVPLDLKTDGVGFRCVKSL